jgi:hypothetical protein
MKKIITTIWNKFLSFFNHPEIQDSSKHIVVKEEKEFAKAIAKKIEESYTNPTESAPEKHSTLLSETIHPATTRKERFAPYSHNRTEVVINDISISLTEKQIIFYNIILELTEEFGKAKAKDICIRYVDKLNYNLAYVETPEWMFRLSAHNKTMKYLLKSGIVIKLNKGYKAIK